MKIEHDIHVHTYLSVCGKDSATIEAYVCSAKKLGIKKIGIADHMWDLKIPFTDSMRNSLNAGDGEVILNWYRVQGIEHCRKILKDIEEIDTEGIEFLFGGEVDYCPGLGAAITVEEAEKLDFMVVPNSHTHHLMDKSLYEPYHKHAEFMLRATMDICTSETAPYVTSLAHPFEAVCCPYPVEYLINAISDRQFKEVFCAAKENNIAAEINTSCFTSCKTIEELRNHYMIRVLSIAKDCDCTFTFGSDSHSDNGQDSILKGPIIADILGITEENLHPFVR